MKRDKLIPRIGVNRSIVLLRLHLASRCSYATGPAAQLTRTLTESNEELAVMEYYIVVVRVVVTSKQSSFACQIVGGFHSNAGSVFPAMIDESGRRESPEAPIAEWW